MKTPAPTTSVATSRLRKVSVPSCEMSVSLTWKPGIAMKRMVQIPHPIDAAPSAGHPGLRVRPVASDRTVRRGPGALPRQAVTWPASGVAMP
ncbi:hypothetical protein GCM10010282_39630 [Streptomyces roseolus]|nr:hypothetical protein GCM10010282_39630 [Streptomyces roseolus]